MASLRHGTAFLFAALALQACATPPAPIAAINFAALDCSATLQLTDTAVLVFDPKKEQQTPVILDSNAACLTDVNGRSALYKVFTLPQTQTPYILNVTSAPVGNAILAPRVMLLDDTGLAKRTTTHTDFIYRGNSLVALFRSHSDEKYLVLSSDTDVLGNSVSRINDSVSQQMIAAGPVFFALYTGSDTATNFTLTPAGHAVVSISPLPAN